MQWRYYRNPLAFLGLMDIALMASTMVAMPIPITDTMDVLLKAYGHPMELRNSYWSLWKSRDIKQKHDRGYNCGGNVCGGRGFGGTMQSLGPYGSDGCVGNAYGRYGFNGHRDGGFLYKYYGRLMVIFGIHRNLDVYSINMLWSSHQYDFEILWHSKVRRLCL